MRPYHQGAMRLRCHTCGREHDLSEISFGADAPLQWNLLSEAERKASKLSDDQAIIIAEDRTSYYLRGCLEIPIRGTEESFILGVWCSLSQRSFEEMAEHWEDPDRTRLGPYFGWLCTNVPHYPETAFMKTMVRQRAVGLRPVVELEPTEHPLAVHQREGIDSAELTQIVATLLHEE